MDLNDIVVFTKVVETKSFTGAAEALGLPKSTVSRKLAQLEERLGVRLVQRTTRKLALTDIAEAYFELEASNKLVDLIEDGFDVTVRFGPMPESTLIARRLCSISLILCAS